MCRTGTRRGGTGHRGSGLTTDPACAAPEEGARSGEHRRAAEEARDGDWVGETRCEADEAERQERRGRKKGRQTERQCSENTNTLHIELHLPAMATATAIPPCWFDITYVKDAWCTELRVT